MGYEYEPPTYKLKFEDHPGLEIKARSVSLREYMDFTELLDQDGGLTRENCGPVFEKFIKFLASWNLERKGRPVPLTVKSLYELDIKLVRQTINGWRRGIEDVPDPLEQSSDGGQQSLEGSIPMTPLSESQAS